MRVEEKLLNIRKIVVRLSIFNQCSLQNNVGIGKRISSRQPLQCHKYALKMLMQRQVSIALVS